MRKQDPTAGLAEEESSYGNPILDYVWSSTNKIWKKIQQFGFNHFMELE